MLSDPIRAFVPLAVVNPPPASVSLSPSPLITKIQKLINSGDFVFVHPESLLKLSEGHTIQSIISENSVIPANYSPETLSKLVLISKTIALGKTYTIFSETPTEKVIYCFGHESIEAAAHCLIDRQKFNQEKDQKQGPKLRVYGLEVDSTVDPASQVVIILRESPPQKK